MVRTYEGRCHCGAVRFRFRSEEITRGIRCNCSICIRRGAPMSERYYGPEDIELLEGKDRLAVYLWGDRMVNHYFCRTCGIHPFHDPVAKPGVFRFNLACVEGLDPLALQIRLVDGRSY